MEVYYHKLKLFDFTILPVTTVGDVKNTLRNWLVPKGITDYSVKLYFSDGTQLSPAVFTTTKYDMNDFSDYQNNLNGKIYVNENEGFGTLPKDVLIGNILSKLDGKDVVAWCGTDKLTRGFCDINSDLIWELLYRRDFSHVPISTELRESMKPPQEEQEMVQRQSWDQQRLEDEQERDVEEIRYHQEYISQQFLQSQQGNYNPRSPPMSRGYGGGGFGGGFGGGSFDDSDSYEPYNPDNYPPAPSDLPPLPTPPLPRKPTQPIPQQKSKGLWKKEYLATMELHDNIKTLYPKLKNKLGFYVTLHRRYDLCEELKKYWVGEDKSNIGMGSLSIDWSTRKITSQFMGRTDLMVVSDGKFVNIFMEPKYFEPIYIDEWELNHSALNIQPYDDNGNWDSFKKRHGDDIYLFLTKLVPLNYPTFIKKALKWNRDFPDIPLKGKTPEEAVKILEDLGWC